MRLWTPIALKLVLLEREELVKQGSQTLKLEDPFTLLKITQDLKKLLFM